MKDLVKWVHKLSDKSSPGGSGNPAIIVGDWRASIGYDGGPPEYGTIFAPPIDLVPETVNTLAGTFTAVQAPGWTPQCTYCPENENILNQGQNVGYFMNQPFLYNWPSPMNAVQDESLLYTDPVVPASANSGFADAGKIPLSQYYGVNIQIIRPPPPM